ncbi:hypothetical protein [Demequina sediminicola]|uniref:hypothetical protein n=1 Tax=Demequina sediminicola TaxID=1095026 RepID=UPI000785F058|nr:hypothetical protein [Demequina sediminicola]
MWSVTEEDIGTSAWNRFLKDGVIKPLGPTIALPYDITPTPALRRFATSQHVPVNMSLSGTGALWVRFGGEAPAVLDVCVPARRHIRQGSRGWPIRLHYSTRPLSRVRGARNAMIASSPQDGHAVESAPRAVVDALRWAPLEEAVPWVVMAAQHGVTPHQVQGELALLRPKDATAVRARNAWQMLYSAGVV